MKIVDIAVKNKGCQRKYDYQNQNKEEKDLCFAVFLFENDLAIQIRGDLVAGQANEALFGLIVNQFIAILDSQHTFVVFIERVIHLALIAVLLILLTDLAIPYLADFRVAIRPR